ncbi:AP2 domain-containing protein [Pseudomonas syringae group genomosp. 3]|uniref:AP2 domain-containing protein n=1 Tax=Pseudomonas syringae group genomosp. 3 TaxID=251701 RepID=UPI0006B9EE43|nr:AP2 domain-containing protein [Pseudomonas syringae group genomosp. 3]
MKLEDFTGMRFGKLVALRHEAVSDSRKKAWLCQCDCGETAHVAAHKLKAGTITSCPCARRKTKTHGMYGTRVHTLWSGMLSRCRSPKPSDARKYTERGITVCERWLKFENFLDDMGLPPDGLTIDRIDNDKGYSPENCRWADYFEQNNNRRNTAFLTHRGVTRPFGDWSRMTGISIGVMHRRRNAGWSDESIINTPVRRQLSEFQSGVTGVFWCSRMSMWRATISIRGKSTALGRFTTVAEAKAARDSFRISNESAQSSRA